MPMPKGNNKTDAQRRASNKYDRAHFTIIAAKVKQETAEQFRSACAAAGTTANAVLTAAISDFLRDHPAEGQTASADLLAE